MVRKWNDLVAQIKSVFHIDDPVDNSVITAESLVAKVTDTFEKTGFTQMNNINFKIAAKIAF